MSTIRARFTNILPLAADRGSAAHACVGQSRWPLAISRVPCDTLHKNTVRAEPVPDFHHVVLVTTRFVSELCHIPPKPWRGTEIYGNTPIPQSSAITYRDLDESDNDTRPRRSSLLVIE